MRMIGKIIFIFWISTYIKSSTLSKRLFGSTSMDKIVISIYDPLDIEKNHRTSHLIFRQKMALRKLCNPFKEAEFKRTYNEEKRIKNSIKNRATKCYPVKLNFLINDECLFDMNSIPFHQTLSMYVYRSAIGSQKN